MITIGLMLLTSLITYTLPLPANLSITMEYFITSDTSYDNVSIDEFQYAVNNKYCDRTEEHYWKDDKLVSVVINYTDKSQADSKTTIIPDVLPNLVQIQCHE